MKGWWWWNKEMEQRTCTFIADDAMLSLQYLRANNL